MQWLRAIQPSYFLSVPGAESPEEARLRTSTRMREEAMLEGPWSSDRRHSAGGIYPPAKCAGVTVGALNSDRIGSGSKHGGAEQTQIEQNIMEANPALDMIASVWSGQPFNFYIHVWTKDHYQMLEESILYRYRVSHKK